MAMIGLLGVGEAERVVVVVVVDVCDVVSVCVVCARTCVCFFAT